MSTCRATIPFAVLAAILLAAVATTPLGAQRAPRTESGASAAPRDSGAATGARRAVPRGVNADQELRIAAFELANGQTIAALDRLDWLVRTVAGDSTAALSDTQRAQLLYLQSQVYARLGMGEELRQAGAALLAIDGSGAAATAVRGELMLDAYRRGDDARVLELANGGDPSARPAPAAFVVGLARYRSGDLAGAEQQFAQMRTQGGPYAAYAAVMHALATARGDSTQAAPAYAAMRALADSLDGAARDAARLTAAQLAFQGGQYDSAAALASTVDSASAVAVQALLTRAWSLYRAHRVDEAGAAFAEFARRYPDLPARDEARVMAGQIMLEAGHADAAAAYFDALADSLHREVAQLRSRGPQLLGDASRHLVEQRLSGIMFADDPQTGRAVTVSSQPFGAGTELLVSFEGAPAPRWPNIPAPDALSFAMLTRRLDTLGLGPAGALPRRVLFADAATDGSAAAYVTRAQALRSAEVAVALAQHRLDEEERMRAARVAVMEGLGRLIAQRNADLDTMAGRIASMQDSLAHVLASLDSSRARIRAFITDQAAAAREAAARNEAVADSITNTLSGIIHPDEAAAVALEAAAAREYRATADEIERNLEAAIARHPVVSLHDSVAARLERSRALLADTRAAVATTAQIAGGERTALDAEEDAATREARAAVAAAEARRDAAAADLVALVHAEMAARAERLIASLEHDVEAAEFGSASALFFKSVGQGAGSGTRVDAPGASGASLSPASPARMPSGAAPRER
ncbi:MAG TPA: hypothetical protein VFK13_11465 [Gemmatimonadaceae bacterium]|nr:hypothetical protein [Gemmatimonadaceae bacterium]